jgi:hypothetical protein
MKSTPRKKSSEVGNKLGSLPASAGFLLSLHFKPEDGDNVPQKCLALFELQSIIILFIPNAQIQHIPKYVQNKRQTLLYQIHTHKLSK